MNHEHNVRKTLDYIENNLKNRIQLEDLSREAYLSKYHYHRLFHKFLGESVNKYISKRRMARAASELEQTNTRIIDIAFKYQYSSQASFTRAFQSHYGLAPGEYRKQYNSIQNHNMNDIIYFNSNQIKTMAA